METCDGEDVAGVTIDRGICDSTNQHRHRSVSNSSDSRCNSREQLGNDAPLRQPCDAYCAPWKWSFDDNGTLTDCSYSDSKRKEVPKYRKCVEDISTNASEASSPVRQETESDSSDSEQICSNEHQVTVAGPAPMPGSLIRLWRRPLVATDVGNYASACSSVDESSTSSDCAEWAEVIRRVITADAKSPPEECLLCETLDLEICHFSIQSVAAGTDLEVVRYEPACQADGREALRLEEVARLQEALTTDGRLQLVQHISENTQSIQQGHITSSAQFRVKATILGCVSFDRRKAVQGGLKQLLENGAEEDLARLYPPSDAREGGVHESSGHDRRATAALRQSCWCRFWQTMERLQLTRFVAAQRGQPSDCSGVEVQSIAQGVPTHHRSHQRACPLPEREYSASCELNSIGSTREKHFPELCSECIRRGGWCSGFLHLPEAASHLDAVALRMFPNLRWCKCEAGVEAEVQYDSERVLLQIRPCLFSVSAKEAWLFGGAH